MSPSLGILLARSVDYAGLFPPAGLSMADSVANYARDRLTPDAWMLARFITPAARLAEFGDAAEPFLTAGDPWALSVLGRGGKTSTEFLSGLAADLADISKILQRFPDRVTAEVIEVRLPPDSLTAGAATELLQAIEEKLNDAGRSDTQLFLEAPPIAELPDLLKAIATHNRGSGGRTAKPWGYKLRTGGVEASAFPAVATVAFAITAASDAGVPMKCTAGLHHPFRHFNQGVNATMHGFLNVFCAAALAHETSAPREELEALVAEESPGAIFFGADGFSWRDHAIANPAIEESRRSLMISFGSCSFDEPRDDLKTLGLWST